MSRQTDMKIVIAGAAGRMGRALIRQVNATEGACVAGGLEATKAADLGADLGRLAGLAEPLGVPLTADALEAVAGADALIDFTVPGVTVELAALAAQARIVHVIGTTGLSPADDEKIAAAARHAVIVRSGNMSLGVTLLAALVRRAAAALGTDWDIEIAEMHHRHKVDAPSGTALLLGEAAAQARGVDLATAAARGRDGATGPRAAGAIGFASLRGGSVVGEHSVIFAGENERIALTHVAEDRAIFARGAVAAALWGRGRAPGLYSISDVLGLEQD